MYPRDVRPGSNGRWCGFVLRTALSVVWATSGCASRETAADDASDAGQDVCGEQHKRTAPSRIACDQPELDSPAPLLWGRSFVPGALELAGERLLFIEYPQGVARREGTLAQSALDGTDRR